MSEIEDAVKESLEQPHPEWTLNSWVAGLVALTATFMAIGNIKDGNIVQAMAQQQAKAVDSWTYYQSKSLKQLMTENAADQLKMHMTVSPNMPAPMRHDIETRVAQLVAESKRYEKEKADVKKEAEGHEKEYERLNTHDDQFDMAEACLTIAMAMFGVSALTRRRWLFFFALSMTCTGALLELSAFLGWMFHPEWLAKLLG